jgi:hypothetical protein
MGMLDTVGPVSIAIAYRLPEVSEIEQGKFPYGILIFSSGEVGPVPPV